MELRSGSTGSETLEDRLSHYLDKDRPDVDEDALDDLTGEEQEQVEDAVIDAASAARTLAELDLELAVLRELVELARVVERAGTDAKWRQLRSILLDNPLMRDAAAARRKLIVFTEHKDTLAYPGGSLGVTRRSSRSPAPTAGRRA